MIHQRINDAGDHWAVSYTGDMPEGFTPMVLVQIQEKGEQVRVAMTPEQAEEMASKLLKFALKTRTAEIYTVE
jgi:hypothetical protein